MIIWLHVLNEFTWLYFEELQLQPQPPPPLPLPSPLIPTLATANAKVLTTALATCTALALATATHCLGAESRSVDKLWGEKAPTPNSFGLGPKGLAGSPENIPTRSQWLVGDDLFPSEILRDVSGRILGGESFLLLSPPSLFSSCCCRSPRDSTSINCSQSTPIKLQTNERMEK